MKYAVYGANGYQGKLVVAELARRGLEPVLVGRNADRLRNAASTLRLKDLEYRTADADDVVALADAFRGCDAVINCAGPFTVSGDAPVRAAISAGCHYVDTAGEQLYIKAMFDDVSQEAIAAGVTAVPAMNDDNVPAGLIAQLAADKIGPVEEILFAIRLNAEEPPSRGSLRGALATMEVLTSGGLGYADGQWGLEVPAGVTEVTFPGASEPTPVVKFPLPPVVTVPRHVSAGRVVGVIAAEVVAGFTAVTSDLIAAMPEGPSAEGRANDRFTILAEVEGKGGHARGIVQGSDSYGITAVIAVEGARRLVDDGPPAGVLAPAQAFDPADFLAFLEPHGVTWSIEVQAR